MSWQLVWPFIYAFLVTFLGFFVKGVAAFGDPLITAPLLSMYYDNKAISPVNLLFSTPINGYIAWKNRNAFRIKQVLPMLVCILLGTIPGTLLMQYAASWVVKCALGLVILGIGVEMITRNSAKTVSRNPVVMAVVSFCSGVTAGLYGINLFFVAYVERTTTDRSAFRGNICFIFFVENVFRLIVYAVRGVYTAELLPLLLATLPGMLLGFLVGSKVDRKLSEQIVRNIVICMFMLGGSSILLKAVITRT